MQPAVSGLHCPSCNHLMTVMSVSGILGECSLCPKPVTVVANGWLHQHQPTDSYSMGNNGDELLETKQDISISEMKSDQSSLYDEGISYEETSRDHNYDSYNSLDDQSAVDTCRTIGHDELVTPTHHKSLPSDSEHATVCRYCREEVKNCYYDNHLVRCSEYLLECKFGRGNVLIPCKKIRRQYQECEAAKGLNTEEETEHNVYNFVINCIAVQETVHRLM